MEKDYSNLIIKRKNKLFTKNLASCTGTSIYGEQLKQINGMEYRAWNPYRSKLAAILLKRNFSLSIPHDSVILYLGAATGTTVSHVSDLVSCGTIYAVEHSPVSMKKLLTVVKNRPNIIPILEDANHPDRYFPIVSNVDFVYQDISQRNQADIFIRNIHYYLKPEGVGIIMVKARSIDVSLAPIKAYQIVEHELKTHQLDIIKSFSLSPFEKDHAMFMVKKKI
jgi:fibrillarin-like pre-rRNA processing protein